MFSGDLTEAEPEKTSAGGASSRCVSGHLKIYKHPLIT